jgi:hypothetical protein
MGVLPSLILYPPVSSGLKERPPIAEGSYSIVKISGPPRRARASVRTGEPQIKQVVTMYSNKAI